MKSSGAGRTIEDLLREARSGLRRLGPRESLAAAREGGLIVDIRSEAQRAEGGLVPGAHFVPRNVLEWRADPACEHRDPALTGLSGPLILMCAEGYQSSLAAAALQGIGATNATDMVGGFVAWKAAGLPVATAPEDGRRLHWEDVHERRDPSGVSWYQPRPDTSLAMIAASGPIDGRSIVDAGAGSSHLVDGLLAAGAAHVTVLDVSAIALERVRARLGPGAPRVTFVAADVLVWTPDRIHDVWHDRALFHFLIDPHDRVRYVEVVRAAVRPGGVAVVATFAADGPPRCSGLAVERYDAERLLAAFGPGASLLESRRELHITPGGAAQPFTWVALHLD
ncbi:MAG TPA: methyltransferase domain-containing protein [Miltoncostaeaceae bacterium]|nr:methyltransferase domain-containing protein [Miltoncostaeaceae bacterium]